MDTNTQWGAFLDDITSSEAKHYLWLRSLSYLEYIGYRKMVKALAYSSVEKGVFHHLTDEIRHSYMLRELADKEIQNKNIKADFDNRFVDIAETYFQDIDAEVKSWVEKLTGQDNPYLCYMLVSYLIEKRAMMVYPQYYARLREAPSKYIIQKIIKDEKEHLNYLEGHIDSLEGLPSITKSHLWDYENTLFSRYLQEFQNCLS